MKHLSSFEKSELLRVCAAMTDQELADRFGVCTETIWRTIHRFKEAGIEVPKRKRGRRADRVYANYPKKGV
jgi:transposase